MSSSARGILAGRRRRADQRQLARDHPLQREADRRGEVPDEDDGPALADRRDRERRRALDPDRLERDVRRRGPPVRSTDGPPTSSLASRTSVAPDHAGLARGGTGSGRRRRSARSPRPQDRDDQEADDARHRRRGPAFAFRPVARRHGVRARPRAARRSAASTIDSPGGQRVEDARPAGPPARRTHRRGRYSPNDTPSTRRRSHRLIWPSSQNRHSPHQIVLSNVTASPTRQPVDRRTDGLDHAGGLVTHDHGRDPATRAAVHAVDVAAADPRRPDPDEDVVGADRRVGDVDELEAARSADSSSAFMGRRRGSGRVHRRHHRAPRRAATGRRKRWRQRPCVPHHGGNERRHPVFLRVSRAGLGSP